MKNKRMFELEIKKLIERKYEGDYWDFKQVWHKDNERLLHDIICFANTAHDKDCYLIIGVSDTGEIIGVNDENRKKQADILDLLSNTVFEVDNIPEVKLNTIKIENTEIDVITIFNSYNVPYYLKSKSKKYNNIKEGYIYTRVGDKNTPISQNASINQIEMLWRKRLGLTQQPLIQIVNRLEYKLEWVQNDDGYYNIYKPEFKLVEEYEDDHDRGEFYVYSQCNSKHMYKNLKIMYNETILKEFELVVLDSGRYKTPVPQWGYVGYDKCGVDNKYAYKYFLNDSIEYKLQKFFFDKEVSEEVYSKGEFDEVVLYYQNEKEKIEFERYVEINQEMIEFYINEGDKEYFEIDTDNVLEAKVYRHRLSTGLALNKALSEFRNAL